MMLTFLELRRLTMSVTTTRTRATFWCIVALLALCPTVLMAWTNPKTTTTTTTTTTTVIPTAATAAKTLLERLGNNKNNPRQQQQPQQLQHHQPRRLDNTRLFSVATPPQRRGSSSSSGSEYSAADGGQKQEQHNNNKNSLHNQYHKYLHAFSEVTTTTKPADAASVPKITASTSTSTATPAWSSSSSSFSSSSSIYDNNNDNDATTTAELHNDPAAVVLAAATNNKGKILEGGKVIDFSSVKASSKAERALAQARQTILAASAAAEAAASAGNSPAATAAAVTTTLTSTTGILGINQDVVDQVGHALGVFCTPEDVQDVAAYLRFTAAATTSAQLFPEMYTDNKQQQQGREFNANDVARYERILETAYQEAGEVTSAFAKTFYMGTMLLPEDARKAIWAVYVWCRRTDEIVDAPRDNGQDDMLLDLSRWELRLEQLWNTGRVVDVYDLCLLHVRVKYPTMDIVPFMDMIRGMLMDVPSLGQDRYATFDELHLYCYRVAGTVGLMSLPIFGCAAGFNDNVAREPALSLGVAFQLTNILRDVGEDAVQRGRVYLPQEDLHRFGVTEKEIFAQQVTPQYQEMMKFQIERARMYYHRARRGVFMLAPESRLPVQSSLDAYGRILDKIEANGYDSLTRRAYVDKYEKLSLLPFSWYRTLDISRTLLPLPGDKPVILEEV